MTTATATAQQPTMFDLHFEQAVKIMRTRDPAEIERDLISAHEDREHRIHSVIDQVKEAIQKNPTMTKLPDLLSAAQSVSAAHVAQKNRERFADDCQRIIRLKDELAKAQAVRK
jgi:hypothetical protein